MASDGGTKSASGAPCGRGSFSLLLLVRFLAVFFLAAEGRGRGPLCGDVLADFLLVLARRTDALALVAPPATLSFALRFECQTRLRPLPSAISGIDRPLTTDSGLSSRMSGSSGLRASSSLALIKSHGSFFSPPRPCMRTRCHRPRSFSPSSVKIRCPFLYPRCGSPSGSQRPRSQIITVPPPYSPCGMVPSNALYSIG